MSGNTDEATDAVVLQMPRDESSLGPIQVSSGANQDTINTLEPGITAGEVRMRLKEVLNIPEGAKMLASGNEVGPDYMIQPGDSLEFIRQAGEKA